MENYIKENKNLWDSRVEPHMNSEFYGLKEFKEGKTSLNPIEIDALKDKVQGKKLLHLQCHFGMDTLSWARLGAEVTGVDISGNAIEAAESLAKELNIPARFVQSDVLKLKENLEDKFDIIFTSYGTICWLPDLNQWASVIKHFLKPNGIFYIADFHPALYTLDFEDLSLTYNYFNHGKPYEEVVEGSYASEGTGIQKKEYFWVHGLSEIVQPLINEGLSIAEFKEFPYSPYNCFPNMKEIDEGKYVMADLKIQFPHVFSFLAVAS